MTAVTCSPAPLSQTARGLPREAAAVPREAAAVPREAGALLRSTRRVLREAGDVPREAAAVLREAAALLRSTRRVLREAGAVLREASALPRSTRHMLREAGAAQLIDETIAKKALRCATRSSGSSANRLRGAMDRARPLVGTSRRSRVSTSMTSARSSPLGEGGVVNLIRKRGGGTVRVGCAIGSADV
jgi:hypothetical protein